MSTSSAGNHAIQLENRLIERLNERPMRTDLEPVKDSLTHVSRPGDSTVVQVVGSNGKGSVVHYLSQLLTRADRHVVSYTSPHFNHPSERFRINNRSISRQQFRNHLVRVNDRVEKELTPFETLFLIAVDLAGAEQPDVLLLEAGMGGRWDATSVLDADLTVLTGIELEHTEYLGETRAEITTEKTAQIPEGTTLVTGPLDSESLQVVDQQIRRKQLTHDPVEDTNGAQETMKRVAGRAGEILTGLSHDQTTSLLEDTEPPPGRLDHYVNDGVDFLLDVGHTPGAVDHAMSTLADQSIEGDTYAVFGCLAGKEADTMIEQLLERIPRERVLLTKPPSERALSPESIWTISLKSNEPFTPEGVSTFLTSKTDAGDLVLVLGSFDLVGWFLEDVGSDGSWD